MQSLATSGILTILHQEEKEGKSNQEQELQHFHMHVHLSSELSLRSLTDGTEVNVFRSCCSHTKQALNKNGVLFNIKTAAKGCNDVSYSSFVPQMLNWQSAWPTG